MASSAQVGNNNSDALGGYVGIAQSIVIASLGVSSATVAFTYPQVAAISQGAIKADFGRLPALARVTMASQFGLKFFQFGVMRKCKRSLDRVSPNTGPLNSMVSYGITGVPMQSIMYNKYISDVYTFHGVTQAQKKLQPSQVAMNFYRTKLYPGIFWCFLRESCATGGGIAAGPYANALLVDFLGNNDYPKTYKFVCGLGCGAVTAGLTQWMHNTALTAGTMAEIGKEKPTTVAAFRKTISELGMSMFYQNYGRRMFVIAAASAVLNMCDIFRDP